MLGEAFEPRGASAAGPRPDTGGRLRALDGLRGLAAFVVLLHHAGLLNPSVADVYLNPSKPIAPRSVAHFITQTPLQLLFSGKEAVLVFFVLSGFVVALPALARRDFNWLAYYPRRIIRLMVPVVASVAFAAVTIVATLHDPETANSPWAAHSAFRSLDWMEVVRNFDLLGGEMHLNNPLWSLRFELIFSLLLPVYVVVAVIYARRWWVPTGIAALMFVVGGAIHDQLFVYLPVFLLGTLMAARVDDLKTFRASTGASLKVTVVGIATLSCALAALDMQWIVAAWLPNSRGLFTAARFAAIFGAALVVLLAVIWSPLVRLLEHGFVQWLGRISFSLYLVHVPIIIAVSVPLRQFPWYWASIIGASVALPVAVLFERYVEGPSHRLSQWVGALVLARLSSRPANVAGSGGAPS
jgi:peptidoglycan/LPS O-acetylase OafA/YrhL